MFPFSKFSDDYSSFFIHYMYALHGLLLIIPLFHVHITQHKMVIILYIEGQIAAGGEYVL